ncbi:MAG TPA: tetratricopeptide repeat protein [Terriglobia bacterium]|nr:tetratricopeptide repeat protein [Terriglobia bacterium]
MLGQEADDIANGTRALYRGDYAEAHALASKYLDAHPDSTAARILVARAEIAEGRYESAYEALRQALDSEPTNIDALYYLERVCTILSQIEFQRLIELAPDSFRSHQLAAESYLAQHNEGEAEKEYRNALKANPDSVEILDALGELKRSEFRFDEALDYYERAAKLAPGDYTSAYGSGACQLFKQNPQRALESFRRAVTIDHSSAAAHLALGDALLRANQAAAASQELKAAIALVPSMRQAYALLARAYRKLGQTREAEQALEEEQKLAQDKAKERETIPDSDDGTSPARPQPPPVEKPPDRSA